MNIHDGLPVLCFCQLRVVTECSLRPGFKVGNGIVLLGGIRRRVMKVGIPQGRASPVIDRVLLNKIFTLTF